MKTTHPGLLMGIGVTALGLLAVFAMLRLHQAEDRYHLALESTHQLERDAAELLTLRSQSERVAWKQRPTTDVLAQVNAALLEAGIPTTRLRGIGESTDSPVSSIRPGALQLHRQSLVVTIEALDPPQLGAFLQHWRRLQTEWRAGRLELTHRSGAPLSEAYDVRLYISAVYYAGT